MKLTPETAHDVRAVRRGKKTIYRCKRCREVEPGLENICSKAYQSELPQEGDRDGARHTPLRP